MPNYAQDALMQSLETLQGFMSDSQNVKKVESAAKLIADSFNSGGKVLSCGNGGSFCDAMHFAEELTGRFRKDRRALPALAMSDGSHITCVANDFGYDMIFAKYVEGFGQAGDCLVAISTSGNSPNVVKAAELARSKKMQVIALTGKSGGKLAELSDISFIVKSQVTDRIQEVHIKIIHMLIEGIERQLFPEHYA
jgi:D-sedoheptulose 7-phosphate isomerase